MNKEDTDKLDAIKRRAAAFVHWKHLEASKLNIPKSVIDTDISESHIPDLEWLIEKLNEANAKIEKWKEVLKPCLDLKYRRDTSMLASNPVQNAAVRDIQIVLAECLKDLEGGDKK
jgi:hypothetical protein